MYPNAFYRVSVKALVRDQSNQILVLKENQDTWSLPGGGLDHGEEPIKGLLRELHEELGVDHATINDFVCAQTFFLPTKDAWLLWLVYGVTLGTDITPGDGESDAQFIDSVMLAQSTDIFEQQVYYAASRQVAPAADA